MPRRIGRIGGWLLLLCFVLAGCSTGGSGDDAVSYQRGQVQELVQQEGSADIVRAKVLGGPEDGQTVSAGTSGLSGSLDVSPPPYEVGSTVIMSRALDDAGLPAYTVLDHWRLPRAGAIFAVILVLAVVFAGWRGLGSLVGLLISVVVLAAFVIPRALDTGNPYPPTAIGAVVVALLGIYIAHGLSRRTTVALVSTYLTLALAVGASFATVALLDLNGVATEDAFTLQQLLPALNLRGLLVCGMIIGMIGILDDITVGQATVVVELSRADPSLGTRALYLRGLRVGREHIASLINTLVLAYVGTSIVFIGYVATVSRFPFWITLNSPVVMEEVARSLAGSLTLIAAVPVTTLLAARFLRNPTDPPPDHPHVH